MKHYLVTRHGQEAVNALFREMNLLIIRSLQAVCRERVKERERGERER
jgi:hypothetical protein